MTSLRQLQIFRSVARNLSYTRAAEELNLTQPAVFTQVRRLQDHLGSALFERIGKRLFLTEAGAVCNATVLVNLRDIEAPKEDDGFEGAFLSP